MTLLDVTKKDEHLILGKNTKKDFFIFDGKERYRHVGWDGMVTNNALLPLCSTWQISPPGVCLLGTGTYRTWYLLR